MEVLVKVITLLAVCNQVKPAWQVEARTFTELQAVHALASVTQHVYVPVAIPVMDGVVMLPGCHR